ncbi:hypothetical protein K6U51_12690 [Vibrio fluvialis]|uniref:hypothetical protein n=1 Tax=Vibrio fluvialis TaxID=676 RepID=UPI001EEB2323|nr:hypothetical protein [Vibrio fluvialis]MCG6387551.1 hypothetical protein [Vibrio fluvialis]MCG6418889.1 hypothetical protein [Vibrio fluvialis]
MATEYVKLTRREFDLIREEIYSSESQSGCMDEEPAEVARKAYDAIKRAEKRNGIEGYEYS